MQQSVKSDPRCVRCGHIMYELADERRVNDVVTLATPNGKYQCFYCAQPSQFQPTGDRERGTR